MNARPSFPKPHKWGRRNLWSEHEVDSFLAQIVGQAPPPRPEKVERLIDGRELADRLRCSTGQIKKKLRELRDAEAADADQSPDQDQAA
jgi:hypothetical protein